MCLGVPMTVIEGDDMVALCERAGRRRRVSLALLGAQPPGTLVLVHIDAAVRVLDPHEAQLIDNALSGVAAAMSGEAFEAHFADLIDRAPELPPHLR